MVSRRGVLLAALAVVLGVAGRIFAIIELYVVAASALGLIVLSVARIVLTWPRLEVERSLHPPKVHCGEDSRVELHLRNTARRRSPVLMVRDPFDGGRRWARFLVPPVRPSATSRAAYRLPTDRRGVFDIGPLEVSVADPFGLAERTATLAQPTQLTVYPRVDEVAPLPYTLGLDPRVGADRPTAVGGVGEDFYALRPYVMGDDLRRVHWPSTARMDDLMIRQEEMPWQGRASIVLDLRRAAHTPESLELAISAAASIVRSCCLAGSLVRVVATDGTDSGFGVGHAHLDAIQTRLAGVRAGSQPQFATALAVLRRGNRGGSLTVVTTSIVPAKDLESLSRLKSRYGRMVLVQFDPSSWAGGGSFDRRASGAPAGSIVIRPRAGTPFAAAWNDAIHSGLVGAGA